jgi:hypothetical protein
MLGVTDTQPLVSEQGKICRTMVFAQGPFFFCWSPTNPAEFWHAGFAKPLDDTLHARQAKSSPSAVTVLNEVKFVAVPLLLQPTWPGSVAARVSLRATKASRQSAEPLHTCTRQTIPTSSSHLRGSRIEHEKNLPKRQTNSTHYNISGILPSAAHSLSERRRNTDTSHSKPSLGQEMVYRCLVHEKVGKNLILILAFFAPVRFPRLAHTWPKTARPPWIMKTHHLWVHSHRPEVEERVSMRGVGWSRQDHSWYTIMSSDYSMSPFVSHDIIKKSFIRDSS